MSPFSETWPSGRRHAPAKGASGQNLDPGFESLRLRQIPRDTPTQTLLNWRIKPLEPLATRGSGQNLMTFRVFGEPELFRSEAVFLPFCTQNSALQTVFSAGFWPFLGNGCGLLEGLVTACIWAAEMGLFLRPGDNEAGLLVGLDVAHPV